MTEYHTKTRREKKNDSEPSLDEIRKKIAAYRRQERGDHTLNPDLLPPPPHRAASVMIPLVQRESGCTVLFTQRTSHLSVHAGQVSFPGGGSDAADRDAIATALREAEEEVGLPPQNVSVFGTLDQYVTRTAYRVTPVVALIEPPPAWKADSFEVAEIFEVPLSYILSPGALVREEGMRMGVLR